MDHTATYTADTKERQKSSLLARSSSNIYKSEKEIDKEIEVEVLRNLHHKHIIKVEEIVYDDKEGRLYIVMEQGKTNIAELIEDKKKIGASFDEDTIRMYMKQLIQAVGYMHDHGYFHRDLKPENLILVNERQTRLIDFGTWLRLDRLKTKDPLSDYVSTRWYRAPECILKFPKYNEKVDIFAIGCIMTELYGMGPAFWGKNALDQLRVYWYALGSPKKKEWPEAYSKAADLGFVFPNLEKKSISSKIPNASEDAIDIIDMMLQLNPKDRPDVATILEHPYFQVSIETSPDVVNPFTSPLGTPERNNSFTQNIFGQANFSADPIPSFGNSSNDADYHMEYSPVSSGFKGFDSAFSKKALLNSGDGLPSDKKISYSNDKASYLKKSRSQIVETVKESSFGGFNLKNMSNCDQKPRKKSQMVIDDEITNISNNQDLFGNKNDDEDLPSFGSLGVSDWKDTGETRRKSQYVGHTSAFADLATFGTDECKEEQSRSISGRYVKQDTFSAFGSAPKFGSFAQNVETNLSAGNSKSKGKPKLSVWDDDELMFAVAQDGSQNK